MSRPVPLALLLVGLAACGDDPAEAPAPVEPGCAGKTLFGRPNASTGLDASQCAPTCTCGGEAWTPPDYDEAAIASLLAWTLDEPPALLTEDPYAGPAPAPIDDETVCGFLPVDGASARYALATYATSEDAEAAGAKVTHFGPCGLCSSLVDLAVYMREEDLTAPVRQCGLDHLMGPMEAHVACLMELGFSEPCAQIWYYNTIHTRSVCAGPCFAALDQPYHLEDGSLNECLACDERESGPVFKAVAGRTRRNTGLANALCRPCDEVRPLVHDY